MSKPITLINRICPSCKNPFVATYRNKTQKYCSPHCQHLSLIGFKHTDQAKENMRNSQLGKKKSPRTAEHTKKLADAIRGRKASIETRIKMSFSQLGRKDSLETLEKKSKSQSRENNPAWKGGVSIASLRFRQSGEYKRWSRQVKKRDGRCLISGVTVNLEAHHIQSYNDNPELILSVENGFTMSKEIHKKFHHIYGYKNNKKQLNEFIKKYKNAGVRP